MRALRSPGTFRRRRGSSFIEILIALAILAVLMIGILQMFSLALLMNQGSAARTDLLYKAQQVVENLRLIDFLAFGQAPPQTAALTDSGVPALAATTSPIYLPYTDGDSTTPLTWAYWGPDGFNVVDAEKLPYRLSYTVEQRNADFWLVTVTATPVDNPNIPVDAALPAVDATNNPRRYLGMGSKLKIVTYSAQIERRVGP